MRLGLIGTGRQGQRYLMEKNGGRHITVSGSRRIPLDDVDGVIIATHPAGHKELALECIAAGKAVLIEKPLALNLADCEEILDAAEKAGVLMDVAHVHLWSSQWVLTCQDPGVAEATYHEHDRDYSAWLDWGPHVLALMAHRYPKATADELRERVEVRKVPSSDPRRVYAFGYDWSYDSREEGTRTPMSLMVRGFVRGLAHHYNFNRRVYRALFAE